MVFNATVSLPLKISLVCLAVGLFVFFIAFGGYNWASGSYHSSWDIDFRFGLWIGCTTLEVTYGDGSKHTGEICSTSMPWKDPFEKEEVYPRGWMAGSRAPACLAVIALTACVICVIVFLITNNRLFIIVSCATAFAACLLAIVTSVVFARDISDDKFWKLTNYKLDWAFAFNIISAIFFFVSGVTDVIHIVMVVNRSPGAI